MTTCARSLVTDHLQCPHSADPNLQLPLHALDVLKLHTFPPTPSCRLSPEQEQLLCHARCVDVGRSTTLDVVSMPRERNTADRGLIWLASTMTPSSIVVKATIVVSISQARRSRCCTHPAVSISIRCCSVDPFSSLFRRPEKMPSCLRSALPAARLI